MEVLAYVIVNLFSHLMEYFLMSHGMFFVSKVKTQHSFYMSEKTILSGSSDYYIIVENFSVCNINSV